MNHEKTQTQPESGLIGSVRSLRGSHVRVRLAAGISGSECQWEHSPGRPRRDGARKLSRPGTQARGPRSVVTGHRRGISGLGWPGVSNHGPGDGPGGRLARSQGSGQAESSIVSLDCLLKTAGVFSRAT